MKYLTALFDTSDFPARWWCGRWTAAHGWLHIVSDVGVWAAYFAIPLVLGYFVARRSDLPFRRVFLLFVAFILLCGSTHLMEAVIFWWPAYRLAGLLKLVTAVVSWITVFALIQVAPTVLAMRTPEELEREVAARADAERQLMEANTDLERRVEERTADLGRSIAALQRERELLRTTLMSIGDGVVTTDRDGNVTGLNQIAEALTGWTNAAAQGQPLDVVFRIVNETTRLPVDNPALRALKEGAIVGLANHTVLIARDGTERPIEDSAAPIRAASGEVVGGVLVFRDIGEKRRLERERQEAQEGVVATLESVTDGFMRYDRDWRIVYVNAEAERINRLTRPEMLGKALWEVFPALVGTKLESEFRRAVAERVTVEFENFYEPFGRWYSLKGYPTEDGGLTTFIRDVTEQKIQREALAASEARFRELADAMPQIVYVTDASGRVEFINRQWLEYTGRAAAETADFATSVHPDDQAAMLREWESAAASGSPLQTEFRLRRAADSEYRWFLARSVPVRDAEGRVATWYGTSTDIHDQKLAENEIARLAAESERQRRLYETVLTNTPDFVYVFSLDHKVVYANEALIRMWGRGHEGAIGKTFLEIGYEPWHAEMHDREIDEVRATRQPIRGEVPFEGTHGRREYDYIFVPVIGSDGEVEAVAGTTRDVTDRKRMESELRELAASLSEAHRRKDEFLATLAHELRNPLAPIRNGLEMIRLAGSTGMVEQARKMMDRQLGQMIRLVDDLLDMSRLTSGKLQLRRERVDLRAVIEAALETTRPVVEAAGHSVIVSVPDQPVFVDGDMTRLAQVVSNLLANSAKYTHQGGTIRASIRCDERTAVVSVADDGIGIPPAMLDKVFEMFVQVDRTLEKAAGGLGIGLSLVKGLVEMHDGSISARSDGEGRGSEFLVRLPLDRGGQESAASHGRQNVMITSASPRRILVVDDNRDSADSLGHLLKMLGHDVRLAYDGEAGIQAAGEFRPEMTICDIGMPKVNGYEAARRIRAEQWGRNMLLVALTGWGQDNDLQKSADAGFDHHLVKPVEVAVLVKLLSRLRGTTSDA